MLNNKKLLSVLFPQREFGFGIYFAILIMGIMSYGVLTSPKMDQENPVVAQETVTK